MPIDNISFIKMTFPYFEIFPKSKARVQLKS